MRVQTERLNALINMRESSLKKDRPTYLEREDLAVDLLEARRTLKDIALASTCPDYLGDVVFVVRKIEKINAMVAKYFNSDD